MLILSCLAPPYPVSSVSFCGMGGQGRQDQFTSARQAKALSESLSAMWWHQNEWHPGAALDHVFTAQSFLGLSP